MTINQIELANTFDLWRVTTNQLITISNDLKEGNLTTTGTVSLENPGGFQSNVSLNVKSGMIYGDAGLLSNVGRPSSITNQKLQNGKITIVSTQGQIFLSSNTLNLGDTVYLNVANLVTVNTDTSVANIASANLVNSVHVIATRADIVSKSAYDKANLANIMAFNAYELANTANVNSLITSNAVAGYATSIAFLGSKSTASFITANLSFDAANGAFTNANLGFNAANAAFITANLSFDAANSAFGAANAGFDTANVAFITANDAFDAANAGFDKANSANYYAYLIDGNTQSAFLRANTSVNSIASSVNVAGGWGSHTIGSSDRRTINFRNGSFVLVSVTDDPTLGMANVSFSGNSVLPNISSQAGATFTGNLTVTGTLSDQYGPLRPALTSNRTAGGVAVTLSRSDIANIVFMSAAAAATSNTYIPPGVFAPGDVIRLWNYTVGAQTIRPCTSITIYIGAPNTQIAPITPVAGAGRNVSGYGLATLTCVAPDIFVLGPVSGNVAN